MKNSNNIGYVSESFKTFSIKFKALLEQANNSDSTIFSGSLDVNKIQDSVILEHYEYFVKKYYNDYLQEKDYKSKTGLIKQSINESFFQHNFNKILDHIILEGNVSLNNQILLENTVDTFKLDLANVGIDYLALDKKALEENVGGFAAGITSALVGVGALPAIGISMLTSFAFALLMPAKSVNDINNGIGTFAGIIGRGLTGAFSIWNTSLTPGIGQSQANIINFDNIDADDKVKELFKKIQKIHIDDKMAQRGLSSLVKECVEQNSNILTMVNSEDGHWLDGFFSPQKYNVLKLIIKAVNGKAAADENDYNTLLRFRKCLSNKLVDVYKLLLISNLQSKKDHTRILNSITKSNSDRPEQLINFLPSETDEDKQLREAILSLIMFRIHLVKLANDLDKGFFEVDKEAGAYLHQKLRSVDGEVEQYLRLNKSRFQPPFEGKPMDRKPSLTKRSLLSKYSLPNS